MRLEAVGKRYGVRQPWVVRGVSADLRTGYVPGAGLAGSAGRTFGRGAGAARVMGSSGKEDSKVNQE